MPLIGLNDYLNENDNTSIFDEALRSREVFEFHIHKHIIRVGRVTENDKYEIKLDNEADHEEKIIIKHEIKFLYSASLSDVVLPLIKIDQKVKQMNLDPISDLAERHHIKNRNLYPLMKEREVLFFSLLEGEILRGIIHRFSKYEINIHLKGGIPVTVLRHSILDVRNKKGRCFLKNVQEKYQDWKKSGVFEGTLQPSNEK